MIKLYVRDKETGSVHRVGDDPHDCLYVMNGVVCYHNLQNGDGTGGGYEFVESGIYGEVSEEDEKLAEKYRANLEHFRQMVMEYAGQGLVLMK